MLEPPPITGTKPDAAGDRAGFAYRIAATTRPLDESMAVTLAFSTFPLRARVFLSPGASWERTPINLPPSSAIFTCVSVSWPVFTSVA